MVYAHFWIPIFLAIRKPLQKQPFCLSNYNSALPACEHQRSLFGIYLLHGEREKAGLYLSEWSLAAVLCWRTNVLLWFLYHRLHTTERKAVTFTPTVFFGNPKMRREICCPKEESLCVRFFSCSQHGYTWGCVLCLRDVHPLMRLYF